MSDLFKRFQGSLLVATACNADLCGTYPKFQKLRESITTKQAMWLQEEYNKASHEGEAKGKK